MKSNDDTSAASQAESADTLRVSQPKESAAGAPAVMVALNNAIGKIGVLGAITALSRVNQNGGFDCPGCAWPEPVGHQKHAEFCENGAKAISDEATRKRVTREFFAQWTVEALKKQSGKWLNDQGRLTEPMMLAQGDDHYRPVSWEDAFKVIAEELNALDSPDEATFYTSGRTSNEAAFLYQLFVRMYGTNNLPDCSNMCHESSGSALKAVIGNGKGSVTLEDFDRADTIFIIGQNPGSNHPRMLGTLQSAKRRGAKIVSINPFDETGLKRFRNPQEVSAYVTRGTPLADLHLPVTVNGDVALLKGLIKAVMEEEARRPGEVLDQSFIAHYTDGFAALRDDIESTSWANIVVGSGIPKEAIQRAANFAIAADRMIVCWAMGLTQHKNAVANIQEVVNFALLRGQIGKPGAGLCPVRGHSNVQGDRTMGIWERPEARFLDALKQEFGFEPPREPGLDTVNTIRAMHDGRIKIFIGMGGNFAGATPDLDFTAEGLRGCRLTVQISTKLNRSHLECGKTALILPPLGHTEIDEQGTGRQFVTNENSMGVVTRSSGPLAPAGPSLRSEVRIVADLAQAVLGKSSPVDWSALADDYDRVREHIERVVPGFEDFNRRIREDDQIVLPHAARDERRFNTESGKARFTVHPIPEHEFPDNRYLMMTVRSHDQFNTTVYTNNDRYRGIANSRMVIFMNPEDLAQAGFKGGEQVSVTSHFGEQTRTLPGFSLVPYEIPRRCVASYYPETNGLIPVDHVAVGSNTPAYKSVVVSLASLQ